MQDFLAETENERAVVETSMAIFKTSRIHGTGGFARENIATGTRIVEYVGEKISKTESNLRCEANNEFIFTINDEYDLDGSVSWNPARFINHSCAPNCEAEWDEEHIWIVALREINAGEELSFNYGYDLEDYKEHTCVCGAPECVGYIVAEEFFEMIRQQRSHVQTQIPEPVS